MPQIEVSFDIDANGILHVSAKDLGTGTEQKIRIEASSGLGDDEIAQMVQDAEENADADTARVDLVDARNKAEQIVFAVEKPMAEAGDKLPDDVKATVQASIDKLKAAAEGEDKEAIEAAITELEEASQAMSAKLYENAGPEGAGPEEGGGEGSTGGDDDDVIDAEYEDASK